MASELIKRINELAKKAKTIGLTEEEIAEREVLRAEYIGLFRGNLQKTLDSTYIMDEKGDVRPLKQKNP